MTKLVQDIADLYGSEQCAMQVERYKRIGACFEKRYGNYDYFVSSPGRIEICGNHTDHNHGVALASAIDLDTVCAVKRVEGNIVTIESEGYAPVILDITDLDRKDNESGTSLALTKGVCKYFVDKGYKIGAFTAYSSSRVFKGAGVSSSASFEILVAKILSLLFNEDKVKDEDLVLASHFAENVYFGKPCGLLDQTAIGMGGISYIDFVEPGKLLVERVQNHIEDLSVMIVNTGGDHSNLTGAYASVREEMESVASYFGKKYLREVDEKEFISSLPLLCEKLSGRSIMRAVHFFEENKRVKRAKEAIISGDKERFYEVVNLSGDSSYKLLQNCYVDGDRSQRIPLALTVAGLCEGVKAKRVHGGGFAGTVLLIVDKKSIDSIKMRMSEIFGEESVFALSLRKVGAVRLG